MDYTYLVTINAEKCRGCRTCEIVCSFHQAKEFNPTKSSIRVIQKLAGGIIYNIPVLCQQCEDPICMNVCPCNAIYTNSANGAKLISKGRCIGCRICVYVCPFGGVSVDHDTKFAFKCDLCGGNPLCIEFCPFGALEYVRSDKIDAQRKRKGVRPILEFQGATDNSKER